MYELFPFWLLHVKGNTRNSFITLSCFSKETWVIRFMHGTIELKYPIKRYFPFSHPFAIDADTPSIQRARATVSSDSFTLFPGELPAQARVSMTHSALAQVWAFFTIWSGKGQDVSSAIALT